MPRIEELDELLDRTERKLALELSDAIGTRQVLEELSYTLRTHRLLKPEPAWREVVARCRRHPITELLREDPFTRRAAVKPRGYPGDAPLMDMIYGVEDGFSPPEATAAGRVVFDYMIHGPACAGVRARRALVATHIDRIAEQRPSPRVLSITAGHLRELEARVSITTRHDRAHARSPGVRDQAARIVVGRGSEHPLPPRHEALSRAGEANERLRACAALL